jgi:phospholipid-binding lipoprotein MlaA
LAGALLFPGSATAQPVDEELGEAAVVEEADPPEAAEPAGEIDDPEAFEEQSSVWDPWEKMNRGIFWFNDRVLDRFFLEPVGIAWDWVMPDVVQTSIKGVYENARFPIIFVNDLLQLKPDAAAMDIGRFVVNTSVGLAGIWDPATRIGLNANDEDFGQTLGYWGVPMGPYLVLPFIGPSNPRDTVGLVADSAARVYPYFVVWYISGAIGTLDVVNRRSLLIDEVRIEREAAFDLYSAVRNAYVKLRENKVNDTRGTPEEESYDLYEVVDDLGSGR